MDHPHLEHGRLQLVGADVVVEAGRLPQQLRNLAPVVLAEVLAHAAAQVDRLAHVQGPAAGVTEHIDAGGAGERAVQRSFWPWG